jgi:hypothetical protein
MAPLLGAAEKFVAFVLRHLPPAPAARPPEHAQVNWSRGAMRKAINRIYDYRSRALHAGVPFPIPMCYPPDNHREWNAPAERPTAQAMGAAGAAWLAKDTPMTLNTFAYLVRGVLAHWWETLE